MFEDTHGPAEWSILKPHADRGALFLVAPSLVLLDVAKAIADDDTTRVKSWLSEQKLARPSPDQLKTWATTPSKTFESVVVAPYVLIRELES
jgi:hypothetical protein